MALTKRQHEVFTFIESFIRERGYSPSFDEIRDSMKLNSLATVHKHIHNLVQKKYITHDPNRSRSIDIVPRKAESILLRPAPQISQEEIRLPLLGRIAAGLPIEAIQNTESISLSDITRSREVYVLEVRGDSMQDEHIMEGDYVIVEKTNTARNGEIVVALVNGSDATLKRLYREGEKVRLQPSNAAMKPIMVPAQAVQVQGRVVGVLRKY